MDSILRFFTSDILDEPIRRLTSNDPTLTELDLSRHNLSAADGARLADALAINSTLITLDLRFNDLKNEGAARLAKSVLLNSTLTELSLASNDITDPILKKTIYDRLLQNDRASRQSAVVAVAASSSADQMHPPAGRVTPTVVTRNQFSTPPRPGFVDTVIQGLNDSHPELTKLNFVGRKLKISQVQEIAKGLAVNSILRTLYLRATDLKATGAVLIAEALKTNSTLTVLGLGLNSLKASGAGAIASALKSNFFLTTLHLGANSLGAEGTILIADALVKNSTLTTLFLDQNSMKTAGAEALAKALKINTTLTSLSLRDNDLRIAGARLLAEALDSNSMLTCLTLSGNSISDKDLLKHIDSKLNTNKITSTKSDYRQTELQDLEDNQYHRDPQLVALFCNMKIPPVVQNKLFNEERVDLETIKFLDVELLKRVGLPELRAKQLLEAIRQLIIDPNRELPDLTDEESTPLASGAQGTIHAAKYHGAPCVVKRFIRGINRPDFDREVRAWKKFRHPNIVQLLAFVKPPDAVIVMERMECSLYDLLKVKTSTLSFLRRLEMGGQIAAGVSYLHAKGFVHRDIKSLNVLVKGSEVRLADFGETHSEQMLHSLMSLRGTTRWIAPELYKGSRPSTASDVFAMGMTLWELLCREVPFSHLALQLKQRLQEKYGLVDIGRFNIKLQRLVENAIKKGNNPPMQPFIDLNDETAFPESLYAFQELIQQCWLIESSNRPSAKECLAKLNAIIAMNQTLPIPDPNQNNQPVYSSKEMDFVLNND